MQTIINQRAIESPGAKIRFLIAGRFEQGFLLI